jgi:hypothetical protein
MNFLDLFTGGLAGASGQMAQGANANSNPYQVAAPQQIPLAQPGQATPQPIPNAMPGQAELMPMGQEFGTQGMPPSLQQTLAQNNQQIDQMVANTPQANFGQFYDGGVLPPNGAIPDRQPIQPVQQSYPTGGSQQMPQAQGYQQAQPQMAQPAQTNFSDFFNMTGSAPGSPSNEQGFDPNVFLRASEGYNRGGLLGALGMILTDYKQ